MGRWYYSDAGEAIGPFTQAKLFELRTAGLITDQTLVWGEGREGWISLAELRAPVTPPPLPLHVPPPQLPQPPSVSEVVPSRSHAWRRFGARLLDTYIHSSVGAIIVFFPWGYLAPQSAEAVIRVFEQPEGRIISIVVGTFLALFVGAAAIAIAGTTLGKLTFGIKILTLDGQRPSLGGALEREFAVWLKGLAMGIPLVSLFANMAGFKRLTERGATSWDEGRYAVTYRPSSRSQTALNVLGTVLCLLAIALAFLPA